MDEPAHVAAARERIRRQEAVDPRVTGLSMAVCFVAMILLAAGLWRLGSNEPADLAAEFALIPLGTLGAVAALVFGVMVIRRRRARWAAVIPAALALSVLMATSASSLHWRWSRSDLERVRRGGDIECEAPGVCEVGWWKVRSVDRWKTLVLIWRVDDFCDLGRAFVAALDDDPGIDAIRARLLASGQDAASLSVSGLGDQWYDMCRSS